MSKKVIGTLKELEQMIKDLKRYKAGFYLLMEYFDSIEDEEKPKVSKKLERLGL